MDNFCITHRSGRKAKEKYMKKQEIKANKKGGVIFSEDTKK